MYTSLYSASLALSNYLRTQLETLPAPGLGFGGGGPRVVSLNSPHEMRKEMKQEGLAVWLYRIERDAMRLNQPPQRIAADLLRPPPMPLHLHYLMVPVTFKSAAGGAPDVEQKSDSSTAFMTTVDLARGSPRSTRRAWIGSLTVMT